MLVKNRSQSITHQIFDSLNARMTLSSTEKAQFDAQVKGYEGETAFDNIVKKVDLNGLMICDLLLSTRDTTYQIDALYISNSEVIIYEIKNYTGQYSYKDGLMYSDNGFVLQDPLAQVRRKQSYLHNLLLGLNQSIKVSSYVVFINAEFYIYLLPKTPHILFAGQLKNHLRSLDTQNRKVSPKSKKLAEKLLSLHLNNFRPITLTEYTFDQLKKGIYCSACKSWSCSTCRQHLICSDCQTIETTSSAIKRTLDEFKLLFPDKKLTRKTANDWCGPQWSDARIRRVLRNNYCMHQSGRSSYYS